jgi:5-methylcytosine-specific restriction endonuclease McrA
LQAKCKACTKAYRDARIEEIRDRDRLYRKENRVAIQAKARARYRENPEKFLEVNRQWAAANKDKVAANKRDYFLRNKEELLAYHKAWSAANRDKRREIVRRYDAAHPEVHRNVVARIRARRAGVDLLHFPAEQLFERMAYYGFKCWMCRGEFQHIDHVKPLSKGGPHLLANLRPACASCNAKKNSRWPFPTAVDWS